MLNRLSRVTSSKGYAYFLLGWSLVWMVFDVLTGQNWWAVFMAAFAGFWAWKVYRIHTGQDAAYNRYYGARETTKREWHDYFKKEDDSDHG